MGVFRGGYRQYDGEFLPVSTRFGVLVASEFSRLLRAKWNKRLVLLAAVPFIVVLAIVIGKVMVEEKAGALPIDFGLLEKLLEVELFIMALLAASAGSGLIADDRRTNALLLYLSKPLTPGRYLIGKGLALGALLSLVYLVPGFLHVAVAGMISSTVTLSGFFIDLLSVAIISSLHVGATVIFLLTLSSMGTRSRYIGLAWVAAYFFSKAVSQGAMQAADGASWPKYLSLPDLYKGSAAFVMSPRWEDPWSLVVLLALAGICLGLLVFRMKRLLSSTVG